MAERRLRRQQSSISVQFDPFAPQYFCCFGIFHAKTLGVLVFFFEVLIIISSASFLFLQSTSYSQEQWQSTPVLILVGISLICLVLLAASSILLFLGVVCYEDKLLILPYIIRQIFYIIGILVVGLHYDWISVAIPVAIFQFVLLCLSLGVYRYFSDMQRYHYKPTSLESSMAFSSTMSRMSHKSRTHHQPKNKLSIGRSRPATIDLC